MLFFSDFDGDLEIRGWDVREKEKQVFAFTKIFCKSHYYKKLYTSRQLSLKNRIVKNLWDWAEAAREGEAIEK